MQPLAFFSCAVSDDRQTTISQGNYKRRSEYDEGMALPITLSR